MPRSAIPGWPEARLESHACVILNRDGLLVFCSARMADLVGSDPLPLGAPPRPFRPFHNQNSQRAAVEWRATVASGVLSRMGTRSGEVDVIRRTGGTTRCYWRYFCIPEDATEYHLLLYEPVEVTANAPESAADRARRMEQALFEILSVLDGTGILEGRHEMAEPLELMALSKRELDVIKQLLEGASNEQIAQPLHVSIHTVKSHAKAIFRKLKVHSRAELLSKFVHAPPT